MDLTVTTRDVSGSVSSTFAIIGGALVAGDQPAATPAGALATPAQAPTTDAN